MPSGIYKRVPKTHCPRGHELTQESVYVRPSTGDRLCRMCKRQRTDVDRKTPQGKERRRWNRLKLKYGLTKSELEARLASQHNCCALCKRLLDEWVVDHDHATGKVRGLVHQLCNLAIGFLEDNADVCRKAAEYLEEHSAVEVQKTASLGPFSERS